MEKATRGERERERELSAHISVFVRLSTLQVWLSLCVVGDAAYHAVRFTTAR